MKKLTYEEFGKVMHSVFQQVHYHTHLRLGQCIFNHTYSIRPELTDSIRATGADCFHNDNKIIHFIDAILEK